MKTKELTMENREEISRQLSLGLSYSTISKNLGKSCSCISREVSRKGMNRYTYRAWIAHKDAQKQKKKQGRKNKLETNLKLRKVVFSWLNKDWSPQQIAERLKLEYPKEKDMKIAPETIYSYLYVHPKEKLRRQLITHLRRKKKYRMKRKKKTNKEETRGKLPNMTSIDERPKEVEGRKIPGHWEGDLIMGYHNKSALGTLTERTTRITLLVRLKKFDKESVRKALERTLKQLPRYLKLSLTYDQGKEMAEHEKFTFNTKIQVYFAHRSSPWERGTNENTNGLVRQYFPKGTDFNNVTKYSIKKAQNLLNDRPRKCLKFKKPIEIFNSLLQ